MKSPKVLATSIGLVMVTAVSAVALNVGIVRATSASDGGSDDTVALAADGSPLVVTLETDALPSGDTTTSAAAEAAPAATAAAPASSAAARSVAPDTAAPTTDAPSTTKASPAPAVAPATTYHTFQAGNAGDIVIANHGDSLEFWAAYTNGGWEYQVEEASGREVKIKFRGSGELEWKAILSGGSIKIESNAGGGDDDEEEEDDD